MSVAPRTANSPNVIATDASAIASGSRRSLRRNTTSSVSAMATSAAISRPTIDPVISFARSLVTTGTPLTV